MLMPNTEKQLPVTKPYVRFLRRLKAHASFVLLVLCGYIAVLAMGIGMAELVDLLLTSVF